MCIELLVKDKKDLITWKKFKATGVYFFGKLFICEIYYITFYITRSISVPFIC